MFASVFNWLRASTRQAILAGVNDALTEIEGDGTDDTAPAVALLRARLQPALTNGTPAGVPANVSGSPADDSAAPAMDSPSAHRNGRRKATPATA